MLPGVKEEPTSGETRWELPQLWKSTNEAFGNIFLMISTSCLEKPSQKHARLFHSYHRAGGGH
jgi:hypothetical protein